MSYWTGTSDAKSGRRSRRGDWHRITTTAPEEILVPALVDLVEQSGYYGADQALDDLRAAIRQLDVEATSPGTTTPGAP